LSYTRVCNKALATQGFLNHIDVSVSANELVLTWDSIGAEDWLHLWDVMAP